MIGHIRLDRLGVSLRVEREGVLGAGTVRALSREGTKGRNCASELARMLGFDGFVFCKPDGDTWIPAELPSALSAQATAAGPA